MRHQRKPAWRHAGLSLVELMVALAIGMVVVLAVTQLYLTSRRSFSGGEDVSRLQENSRFALGTIERGLRNAGFEGAVGRTRFSPGEILGAKALVALAGVNDAGLNRSDEFTVQFFGMDNAAGTAAEGGVLDCTGTALRAGELAQERYFVARDPANTRSDPAGEPSLFCEQRTFDAAGLEIRNNVAAPIGDGVRPPAMTEGVETMQALYGRDTNGDGFADRWVAAPTAIEMNQVVSLRIALVLRTPPPSGTTTDTATYNLFGLDYAPGSAAPAGDAGSVFDPVDDRRVRRVMTTTVALRNRLP